MSTVINIAITIGVLILIFTPYAIYVERKRKRVIENSFAGREALDEMTFYERYFQAQGVPFFIVLKVRKILEETLEADLSRLRAEDDFTKNLSYFFQYDSWASIEIVERLEEEFAIKITDAEAARTHTVEEIINLVWLKLSERAA